MKEEEFQLSTVILDIDNEYKCITQFKKKEIKAQRNRSDDYKGSDIGS